MLHSGQTSIGAKWRFYNLSFFYVHIFQCDEYFSSANLHINQKEETFPTRKRLKKKDYLCAHITKE